MFTLASNVPIALKEQKRERVWFTQNFLYHHPLRNRVMFKVNWFISSILVAFYSIWYNDYIDICIVLLVIIIRKYGLNVRSVSVGTMTF